MKFLILLLLASCTTPRYHYAPVKITTEGKRIYVRVVGGFKPMPDTTVDGYIIKQRYKTN